MPPLPHTGCVRSMLASAKLPRCLRRLGEGLMHACGMPRPCVMVLLHCPGGGCPRMGRNSFLSRGRPGPRGRAPGRRVPERSQQAAGETGPCRPWKDSLALSGAFTALHIAVTAPAERISSAILSADVLECIDTCNICGSGTFLRHKEPIKASAAGWHYHLPFLSEAWSNSGSCAAGKTGSGRPR